MTRQSQYQPLALIGLDAAEISVIERGISEGWLPNLARLLGDGSLTRLRSDSDILVGSIWPSFYSGQLPPEHGVFGVVQWRADQMRHERPDDRGWIDTTPFYRSFGRGGPRVLAIDAPFAPSAQSFPGTEILSWNAHATRGRRGSWPEDLVDQVKRRHGSPKMRDEIYGPQTAEGLLRLRDRLIASTHQQSRLALDLIANNEWDMLLLGFGAIHRAGHKLQAPMILRRASDNPEIGEALKEVYRVSDESVGEVVAALPDDCRIIIFSLNGMVPNTSHHFLMPEMLRRILEDDTSDTTDVPLPLPSPLHRVRAAIPLEWRSAAKEVLPVSVKDAMGRFWRRAEARDWSNVKAFRLIGSDFEGQIQINLRGRERDGVVEPGDEYEALCDKIVQGLPSFVDEQSGEPIIAAILRSSELWPEAHQRLNLPDLLVQWSHRSPVGLTALRSPRYGAFRNRWPERPPDGRSGHHQPIGWVFAQNASSAKSDTEHPVQDLTATVFAHFGMPVPEGMRGSPINELLSQCESV